MNVMPSREVADAPVSPRSARSSPATPPGWEWLLGLGLLLATLAAYWPALGGIFLWNDRDYVTAAHLRSLHGLWRIWFEVGATEQYYPLLHTAFWLEHRLWGDAPLGYHLAIVFQHAANAALFALFLRRVAVQGAWLAGFVFALHPVAVESVAWISEQKNTLSALFFLLAAHAWLRFDARRRVRDYALATILFLLALASKTTTAMLPVALLVLQWWRQGRLAWRGDVLPLLPWIALGASAGLFSAWVEREFIGAEGGVFVLEPLQRVVLAGRVIWFYLGKLLWPAGLVFVYPRWTLGTEPRDFLAVAAVVAGLGVLWWKRDGRLRPVLVVALYFGALLFPVMGFLNVYFFRYAYVGDHFQYLASMGPMALAGAGLHLACFHWRAAAARITRLVPVALLVILGVLTWRQSRVYRSDEILWRTTVARNPAALMAWLNLGDTLARKGDHDGAIDAFSRAIQLSPTNPHAHNDLACEYIVLGRHAEAVPLLERAIQLEPDSAESHNNLGMAQHKLGRTTDAIASFERAVQLRPDYVDALGNLGSELVTAGRASDAIAPLSTAVRLAPNDARAHLNLGNTWRELGRMAESIASYEEALRLSPGLGEAHASIGLAFALVDRRDEALAHLGRAAQLLPDSPLVRFNLGTAFARVGRLADAIDAFEVAVRLAPDDANVQRALADVLANSGRWPEAVAHYANAARDIPEDADLRANFGVALASTGRLDEAVTQFETALRLRPGFATAHANLGEVLHALGRYKEAAVHLEEAARLQESTDRILR